MSSGNFPMKMSFYSFCRLLIDNDIPFTIRKCKTSQDRNVLTFYSLNGNNASQYMSAVGDYEWLKEERRRCTNFIIAHFDADNSIVVGASYVIYELLIKAKEQCQKKK